MPQISRGVQRAAQSVVSSSAFFWGVAGALLTAEVAYYYTVVWLRARARRPRGALPSTSGGDAPADAEGAPSVRHYWGQLRDAVLSAPRASLGDAGRRLAPLAVADDVTGVGLPDALRVVWEDHVRYAVDEREVLRLLRRAVKGPTLTAEEDLFAAAALALLWRLQLTRAVHTAVVVSGDVSQCSGALADLGDHSTTFYRAFIRPLAGGPAASAVAACWFFLSEELRHLRRRRRRLQLQNTWSLAKYLYAGCREKLLSSAMMGLLTAVAAHSATTGLVVREQVERLLSAAPGLSLPRSRGGCRGASSHATGRVVVGLLAFEWARLVATAAVMRVTEDYIRTSASSHRESVKRQLYEALAHTPLSFFDTREQEEVEQLIYYANDLEGVDVQVHDYLARFVRAAAMFAAAAAALDRHSRVVVVATVGASSLLTGMLNLLRRRCAEEAQGDNVDVEEEENGNMATDGVMLRGMEIIEHIYELRPYGADATLMRWWTERTAQDRKGPGMGRRILRVALSLRRLWNIDALTSLTTWLLPAIVTAQAAATCQAQGALMEAMRAVQELLDEALDARRLGEVVLSNAYKANALERIIDTRHWEREEPLKGSCCAIAVNGSDDADNVAAQRGREAGTGALLSGDVEVEVHRIRADGLQFQYPTAPTVNAFLAPASFTLQLQDDLTGAGRLVCVTGPSGCGKTTLLRLLLALYTTDANRLMLQLRHRRGLATQAQTSHDRGGVQGGSNGTCDGDDEGEGGWIPVASLPRRLLRATLFSYMPQTATIFAGATIAQNITLRSQVSVANLALLSRVRSCAEAAACMDFIGRLPQGFLTPLSLTAGWVTPGGVRLSCGQGQRLMLARALYHGGGVLLMDEPTAGLDAASKEAVMTQLMELLRSKRLSGALCVTHDAELLQRAHQVVRL
ncbi:ABC transporter [Trypanosoma conorhini]|uniref:ABC transporter n=1 Tax=Trypanosoma conorhini TaxID=83891 RepID=A0A422Q8Q5_9TRYP|nr:ABC transporter [Trypanosoma conorhini]RNF26365.1 ABC transporter [Trypanosoma conorhini]